MDVLWTDERGLPWYASADPAALAECEVPDGLGGYLVAKRLRQGFVREELLPDTDGRTVVLGREDAQASWSLGDLLAARRRVGREIEPEIWLDADRVCARLGISRDTLDRIVAHAPPSLAGAPVDVGDGRHTYRWRAETVDEWFAAYGRWRAPPPAPPRSAAPAPRSNSSGKVTRAEVEERRRGRSRSR